MGNEFSKNAYDYAFPTPGQQNPKILDATVGTDEFHA